MDDKQRVALVETRTRLMELTQRLRNWCGFSLAITLGSAGWSWMTWLR